MSYCLVLAKIKEQNGSSDFIKHVGNTMQLQFNNSKILWINIIENEKKLKEN